MTGARRSTSGTSSPYRVALRIIGSGIGAEDRPRGLSGRGAVATDRAVATRTARVDLGHASPLLFLPHARDGGAQLLFDRGQGLVVELPRLGVLVDLGLQVLVPQPQ